MYNPADREHARMYELGWRVVKAIIANRGSSAKAKLDSKDTESAVTKTAYVKTTSGPLLLPSMVTVWKRKRKNTKGDKK